MQEVSTGHGVAPGSFNYQPPQPSQVPVTTNVHHSYATPSTIIMDTEKPLMAGQCPTCRVSLG